MERAFQRVIDVLREVRRELDKRYDGPPDDEQTGWMGNLIPKITSAILVLEGVVVPPVSRSATTEMASELYRGMTAEELLRVIDHWGKKMREEYQEQKDLLSRITIRVDEIGAWRIDIRQDEETKRLVGRLQISHKADDVLWENFLEEQDESEPPTQ